MKTFKETHPYDPLFPYRLMHREQWHYSTHQAFHFHEWYELVFVHNGEGVFIIDQSFYDMAKGDVFLVPGNVLHYTNPSKQNPYLVSVLLFDANLIHPINLGESYFYLQSFEQSRHSRHYKIPCPDDRLAAFERTLASTFERLRDQTRGCRHYAVATLHQVLSDVNDLYSLPDPGEHSRKPTKSEIWLKEILVFIDNHLARN
ncbi:AraC family ligand binding domain-containing protein [Paenibacillaceae bacterium WGS1546]|uniref:AraC family ligand binding domain-containing protein n=1 Tax=Cohnella sp. WGS1546 TaxID=3366810 RepID=UPI00372D2B5F